MLDLSAKDTHEKALQAMDLVTFSPSQPWGHHCRHEEHLQGDMKKPTSPAPGETQGQLKCLFVTPRDGLSGQPGKGLRVPLVREGCDSTHGGTASSRWYTRRSALDGMVGEVIMKGCCDIHSTDLPNGV